MPPLDSAAWLISIFPNTATSTASWPHGNRWPTALTAHYDWAPFSYLNNSYHRDADSTSMAACLTTLLLAPGTAQLSTATRADVRKPRAPERRQQPGIPLRHELVGHRQHTSRTHTHPRTHTSRQSVIATRPSAHHRRTHRSALQRHRQRAYHSPSRRGQRPCACAPPSPQHNIRFALGIDIETVIIFDKCRTIFQIIFRYGEERQFSGFFKKPNYTKNRPLDSRVIPHAAGFLSIIGLLGKFCNYAL